MLHFKIDLKFGCNEERNMTYQNPEGTSGVLKTYQILKYNFGIMK